uniref:Macrolide 2'-phosphotransferase n=1 Tax=Klebsiella pneumoniae TaxID=573 RepID=A0A8B0SUY7_KLEPN|nr:Macrolide 2'-phosphotransferase [Klebsiella pneumoniae]
MDKDSPKYITSLAKKPYLKSIVFLKKKFGKNDLKNYETFRFKT